GQTAAACALASVFSGLMAGWVHQMSSTRITPLIASITGSISVLLQMALILLLSPSVEDAMSLVEKIILPIWLVTASGCYLFIYVMQIIDSDHAQRLANLNAQIEPHFLMNTMNAIRSLVRIDPDKARTYITRLGEFMQAKQHHHRNECITVGDELAQAQRYMDFQQLRFPKKIHYQAADIDHCLLDLWIPSGTLLTLLENALTHGRRGRGHQPLDITVRLYGNKKNSRQEGVLEVMDNGRGIELERYKKLGKQPLISSHQGGGHALYHLAQMLPLYFGSRAHLQFINRQAEKKDQAGITGTIVRIILPRKQKLKPWVR
ncbi:MAG TPA: hypothetical protein ENJ84_05480, partial [Gammaproteobacteria bacterium]|nr:hypothetical protein [Gammaproteobacteria bacterium]